MSAELNNELNCKNGDFCDVPEKTLRFVDVCGVCAERDVVNFFEIFLARLFKLLLEVDLQPKVNNLERSQIEIDFVFGMIVQP